MTQFTSPPIKERAKAIGKQTVLSVHVRQMCVPVHLCYNVHVRRVSRHFSMAASLVIPLGGGAIN